MFFMMLPAQYGAVMAGIFIVRMMAVPLNALAIRMTTADSVRRRHHDLRLVGRSR